MDTELFAWQESNLIALDSSHIPFYELKNPNAHAAVHFIHGMSEHGQRYQEIASWFYKQGFNVSTHDQRGHGKRIKADGSGHLGGENAWKLAVDDIHAVYQYINLSTTLPVILIGHSLGSIMLQDYLSAPYAKPAAAILSGTAGPPGLEAFWGSWLCQFENWRLGELATSSMIHQMSFKRYNRHFKNTKTPSDWLSRDEQKVQAFIDDPWCGFECTIGTWSHVLYALKDLHEYERMRLLSPSCPVMLIAGDDDPVGEYGQSVRELHHRYQLLGVPSTIKLYSQGRHEMFNEVNRQEVYQDCLGWIQKNIL